MQVSGWIQDLAWQNPLDLWNWTLFGLLILDMCLKQTCVIKQCFCSRSVWCSWSELRGAKNIFRDNLAPERTGSLLADYHHVTHNFKCHLFVYTNSFS
jgi:hypothetical protein